MNRRRRHRWWFVAAGVVLLLVLAGLVGMGGCGTESSSKTGTEQTSADGPYSEGRPGGEEAAGGWGDSGMPATVPTTVWTGSSTAGEGYAPVSPVGGNLTAWERAASQKIISDAQLEIEVEKGQFQSVFTQALLLADRYGGYVISSSSSASDEEGVMQSGVIALRVPAASFDRAVADAAGLGTLKNRRIQTQDVTEEYVDLQARVINAEAQVKALRDLLARAKTVDEILSVQQYLANAQADLESLKGRLRYLDEHTAYSTLTLTIYERGVTVTTATEWGVVKALKDALRNLVDAFNAIIRGLGVLVPVVIVLAIIALVVYLIWRAATRKRRARQGGYPGPYPPYPQGWTPAPGGPGVASGPAPGTGPSAAAGPAPVEASRETGIAEADTSGGAAGPGTGR